MEAFRFIPHYTVADYEQWEGDWELWQGTAVSMSPSPIFVHQRTAAIMLNMMENALRGNDACKCVVVQDVDWRVAIDTIVRPDLAVMCEPIKSDFINKPPTLIIELLSPSTAGKDRTAKRSLYESQGVGYYLIADPQKRTIEALQLHDGRYTAIPEQASGIELVLDEHCQMVFDTEHCWAEME